MAFSAVASLFAAETVTATMVLGAMAEVGTAMTIVGAVTGSKDLMKIGGVMGLVGGIGGMVAGAGGAVSGAVDATGGLETAVGGSVPGQIASDAATQAGMAGAESSWNFNMGDSAGALPTDSLAANTSDALRDFGDTINNPATPGSSITPQVNPAGTPINGASNVAAQSSIATPTGPSAPSGPVSPADTSLSVQGNSTNVLDSRTGVGYGSKQPVGFTDYFDKFIKYAQQNKDVFNTITQLGGGMLKGMNERDMFDEKLKLEQQRLGQTSYGNQVANYAKPLGFAGAAQRGV